MYITGSIFISLGIFGLLYTYLLYNLLLLVWSKINPKKINTKDDFIKSITIIISAHNEENLIDKAINSIFESNYPKELIKVIVGSDGSNDKTFEICKTLEEKYNSLYKNGEKKIIECFDFPRAGKNATLNKLTPLAKTDLICFMDADVVLDVNSIKKIVSNFADENIGAVIAPMVYIENVTELNAGFYGEKLYQSFESLTKKYESDVWSTVNSLGAFYCVRKSLYNPLKNDKVCDDLIPILDVNLAKKRAIYEMNTCVYEIRRKSLNNELNRRIRVSSGTMEALWETRKILFTNSFRLSFFVFSHKIMRYLTPLFLLFIFVGTLLILHTGLIAYLLLLLQVIFLLLAFIGYLFEEDKIKFTPAQLSIYFLTMNLGFVLAFVMFLRRKTTSTW